MEIAQELGLRPVKAWCRMHISGTHWAADRVISREPRYFH